MRFVDSDRCGYIIREYISRQYEHEDKGEVKWVD